MCGPKRHGRCIGCDSKRRDGEGVVTLAMMTDLHQRPKGTAGRYALTTKDDLLILAVVSVAKRKGKAK